MTGYISTRGQAPRLTFSEAALAGLARDGGLYVPDHLPARHAIEGATYAQTAFAVMRPFIGDDIPDADLTRLIAAACKPFAHAEIAPLVDLSDGFYLQELFHGPTLAFKDIALQFLGQVFDYILRKRGERVTIVGATSGDTGSAAIEAFRGSAVADIVILHPRGRVSEVQRRQMTTVDASNVFNIAIEGSFDDCQDIVKALFNDLPFRDGMRLSAINSINWARILAQTVYYAYAAAQVFSRTGRAPAFCVPTGNFGNVYAGYIARSIGFPIDKLVVATNSNDILHRFFSSGRMEKAGVRQTASPSMDIQAASNFERLLFDLDGRDGSRVAQTMQSFQSTGAFALSPAVMEGLRDVFASGSLDDAETQAVIRSVWEQNQYLLDPHSAVGFGVAQAWRQENPGTPVVCLATAHPAKFPDVVRAATGLTPPLTAALADLYDRRENFTVLPADKEKVQDFMRQCIAAKGGA